MSDTRTTYRMANGSKVIRGEFADTFEVGDLYHVSGHDIVQEQWKLMRSRVVMAEHCQECADDEDLDVHCPVCDNDRVIVEPKDVWVEAESTPSAEEVREVLLALGGMIAVSSSWGGTGLSAAVIINRLAKSLGIDLFEGTTVETAAEPIPTVLDTITTTNDWLTTTTNDSKNR